MIRMLVLVLVLLSMALIPTPEAACTFSAGWKSVADSSRAVQVQTQKLIPTQACSPEEGFCLTFFSFIPNAYYLSMVAFLSNSSTLKAAKIIWTANRGSPVTENSTLEFTETGELILETPDRRRIWSTNTSMSGVVSLSVCGGKLRLVGDNNRSLWRSFDYPTDTLTPGQKLKPGMQLISSKSSTDLSEGNYSLVVDNCGGVLYYSSGVTPTPLPYWAWLVNGTSTKACDCSGLCMSPTSFFLIGLGSAGAPKSAGDSCIPTTAPFTEISFQNSGGVDPSPYTYLKLETDGVLRAASFSSGWSNVFELDKYLQDPCFVPTVCSPYAICNGNSQQSSVHCICPVTKSIDPFLPALRCKLRVPLEANCTGRQALMELTGVDYKPNKYMAASSNHSTENSCKNACLHNCSCLAAFYWKESGSCFHATGSLETLTNTGNQTHKAYLKIQLPQSSTHSHARLIIGLCLTAVGLIILIIVSVCYYLTKQHIKLNSSEVEKEFGDYQPTGQFRRFSLKELHRATKGFGVKIGEGAFSTVFLGRLEGNSQIAVKRVECSTQGKKSFRAEMETLGNVQHVNLVHLLGFCAEGNELMLIYEFVAKGSLDRWIFHDSTCGSTPLSWKQRWKIANGVARGLAYLHEECRKCILHLDVKPQNILLDENFEAKVSDFGLSSLMEREQSHLSMNMRGTLGYLAPEWWLQSGITSKSDVYSFGMVVFQLISGRKNLDESIEDEIKMYYPSWAWSVVEQGGGRVAAELVDPILQGEYDEKEVEILLWVGFRCIQGYSWRRPSMTQVLKMLAEKKVENDHILTDPINIKPEREGSMEFSSILSYGRLSVAKVFCIEDDENARPNMAPVMQC